MRLGCWRSNQDRKPSLCGPRVTRKGLGLTCHQRMENIRLSNIAHLQLPRILRRRTGCPLPSRGVCSQGLGRWHGCHNSRSASGTVAMCSRSRRLFRGGTVPAFAVTSRGCRVRSRQPNPPTSTPTRRRHASTRVGSEPKKHESIRPLSKTQKWYLVRRISASRVGGWCCAKTANVAMPNFSRAVLFVGIDRSRRRQSPGSCLSCPRLLGCGSTTLRRNTCRT